MNEAEEVVVVTAEDVGELEMDVEDNELEETVDLGDEEDGFGDLFESPTAGSTIPGQNQLNKTAQLTAVANDITNKVLQVLRANPKQWDGKIKASQQSHDAMDDLIDEIHPLDTVDVKFLKTESEDTIEKMIRSQQSKRSRSKSKTMNIENYKTMMVGAVAENLLRIASGKAKNVGSGVVMRDIGFSAEDLEQLAEFPEELKKAIRNVQSKKSIMKSKADFDPMNSRWLQLCAAEQQLKDIRDRGSAAMSEEARKALEAQKHAEEILAGVDTEEMSGEDAKALLDSLKEMLAGSK